MTSFDRLVAGGDSKAAAVVPKQVDESHLIDMITPEGDKAEMPKDKPPLSKAEIDLIRNWIAQGAVDDTPERGPQSLRQGPPPRLLAARPSSRPWITRPTARRSPSAASTRSCSARPTARGSSPA